MELQHPKSLINVRTTALTFFRPQTLLVARTNLQLPIKNALAYVQAVCPAGGERCLEDQREEALV